MVSRLDHTAAASEVVGSKENERDQRHYEPNKPTSDLSIRWSWSTRASQWDWMDYDVVKSGEA
ncbi:hypothetical protein AWB75_05196 [Caballeronia catudaia]|uniref:Uncharacterized protein n=1 Tax=Caballeronia catudaia TaxID=1777136 RepID=A0A158CI61_9BURK|nr:hypothetical protein AWB75_05196 [Caballeronia catudaia]